ncbi:cache domain-containing sensor histidine kinase [Breznakiella homolactica]|uniref:histidine kinase n=1 Tax=Breznakiella homolactica TaxID=2798577 RepID=A0A7T8B986_9SPIR|nr:sensor histidine kinase [Breznakiella homolactica]QQO09379.1 sensor histidine kinase [Breznakiella homolactica]
MTAKIRSIRKKLVRFMLAVLILSTALSSVLLYIFLAAAARNNAKTSYGNQALLVRMLMLRELRSIEQVNLGVMFNSTIQNLLMDETLLHSYRDRNIIASVLIDHRNFLDVGNITLFSLDGRVLASSEGYNRDRMIQNLHFYPELEQSQGAPVWITSHIDTGDDRYGREYVITLAQKIRRLDTVRPENNGIPIGYVVFNIGETFFSSLIEEARWDTAGSLYLADREGIIISHPEREKIGGPGLSPGNTMVFPETRIDRKKGFLISTQPLDRYPWYIEGIVPVRIIMEGANGVITIGIIVSFVFAFVFALVATRIATAISAPLGRLEKAMASVDLSGTETVELEESPVKEIRSITRSYEAMVTRLSGLTEEVYRSKLRAKEYELAGIQAELAALQNQINPHFLYNTLDSINWMADMEGNTAIVEMVTRLGDFLRFSARGTAVVTIGEELDYIDNYIYIQKIRYGSRFSYKTECSPALRNIPVIKLTIQPLVENAVIHGAENLSRPVDIVTRIGIEGDFVRVSVSDNGSGMDSETRERLLNKIQTNQGIGLSNVYQRLKLSYPGGFDFSFTSDPGTGTEISFAYPLPPEIF